MRAGALKCRWSDLPGSRPWGDLGAALSCPLGNSPEIPEGSESFGSRSGSRRSRARPSGRKDFFGRRFPSDGRLRIMRTRSVFGSDLTATSRTLYLSESHVALTGFGVLLVEAIHTWLFYLAPIARARGISTGLPSVDQPTPGRTAYWTPTPSCRRGRRGDRETASSSICVEESIRATGW